MAFLVTLIVLLILAGVSLSALFGGKGLFNRAEKAGAKYNEAKAREVLETVLLADGQYEKNTNPQYNQDEFLDALIKSEIPGSDVKGDVAIIGEYAYELDRSVPKIGRYLGKASDLVWPTVDATVKLAEDKKDATITITASEEKQGINKIEIWMLGEKIDEFPYDNVKTEITLPYTATQNGEYTIKAYGKLWDKTTVEVEGIVASVKFEPNGNSEWQKEHQTTVTIQETADKVVSAKYVWTNSVTTPEDNEFPEEQTFNSGDTILKNELTGTYYLWTMLETQSGEKLKWRSEGFNFDNQGPIITDFMVAKYSIDGITFSGIAEDNKAGITKIEFYVDGKIQEKYTKLYKEPIKSNITINENITGLTTGANHICKVVLYDELMNDNMAQKTGATKRYAWGQYGVTKTNKYELGAFMGTVTGYSAYGDTFYALRLNDGFDASGTWESWSEIGGTTFSNYSWTSTSVDGQWYYIERGASLREGAHPHEQSIAVPACLGVVSYTSRDYYCGSCSLGMTYNTMCRVICYGVEQFEDITPRNGKATSGLWG